MRSKKDGDPIPKDIKCGTLHEVLNQADLMVEEFIELLSS